MRSMLEILEDFHATHQCRFGFLRLPETVQPGPVSASYMLFLKGAGTGAITVCTGELVIHEGRGELSHYSWSANVNADLSSLVADSKLPFYEQTVQLTQWDYSRLRLPGAIPRMALEDWTEDTVDRITEDDEHEFFWSDAWNPEYYLRQANMGCIAITHVFEGKHVFLPQLQKAYAVLDWPNRRVDRGASKILNDSDRMAALRLKVTGDIEPAVRELLHAWGDETWLCDEYVNMLRQVGQTCAHGMKLYSVLLYAPDCDSGASEIAAGELGYVIGRVYTSLSGFFHRGKKCWNHLGKVQLHLLAQALEQKGIVFWNLGHPYMDYKLKLGAEITDRKTFVQRWRSATQFEHLDISID